MKRLLIPILLFLCLSIANAQTFSIGDFKYTVLSGNDVNVAKADEAVLQGELTIPETVNYEGKDYTVTTIAAYGFQETDITSLNLPNSISKIGKYAFYNCQELKNADIPESLTKIENWIFIECSNLERLTISKNVKEVGYGFVSACHQLRTQNSSNITNDSSPLSFRQA